ncbi:MAG: hypothetical protein A2934_01120 [Candidatus Sungbacteria bacterium RIFCSPLOWO2_01_FULL_47_10]|uniref:General secretion pathway GspH domain-containing protein n=1 Tax=Candidatus Sungbacteria bacterium RIFCSPLOWO2_01_FULL_47_10 TaxID=1802276 RepID=A0A1G2L511_9BACT|nr:MAG: hypothetical protein A2934_01120 [Candidatus Sungbacteria bacterium RIFCSPLOWO2_01_FULL_47_10]
MKAFTIVEILISIAVVGVLVAIVMAGLSSFRESTNLTRARDIVFQTLKNARIQTLASDSASSFGVRFASTSITLFMGNGYNPSDASNKEAILPVLAEISSVGFEGTTSAEIYFRRLTGEPSNTGTITLRSARNEDKILMIEIFSSGLITAP